MCEKVSKTDKNHLYSIITRINDIESELLELATMNTTLYNQNKRLKSDKMLLKQQIRNLKIVLNNLINEANKYLPRENHFEFDCMRKAQIELNKGR